MIELALLVPTLLLAFLLWDARHELKADRNTQRNNTDAWEERLRLERKAQTEEREAWRSERKELNQRIQAPEVAVRESWEPTREGRQYVPFDDDDAFKEARENLNGRGI